MTAVELIACFCEFGFRLLCFMLWALLLKILHIFSTKPLNITPKTKNIFDYVVIDRGHLVIVFVCVGRCFLYILRTYLGLSDGSSIPCRMAS